MIYSYRSRHTCPGSRPGFFSEVHMSMPEYIRWCGSGTNPEYCFEYSVKDLGDRAEISVAEGFRLNARTFVTDRAVISRVAEIIEKYRLVRWDGFDKSRKNVLDGRSFSVSFCCGGKNVSCSGYERYPKNYKEAAREFTALIKELSASHLADIEELTAQCRALTEGVPYTTANLANIAALIFNTVADLNWAGFYLTDNGSLVLGPFQGKPACIKLKIGESAGVCGTAAFLDETVVVKDVHEFKGHVACDAASASEIVVPLHKNGEVAGVLDIDSPLKGRFTEYDKELFEAVASAVEEIL